MINIIKTVLILTQIININAFMISEGGNIFQFNKNQRKSTNILNLKSRFCNNISRRNILYLSPIILNPKLVLADNNLEIKKIAVFGASGYTGGDTIRNLLNRNKEVIALTRRQMEIVDREHMGKNTLVIDDIQQKNKITNIVCDVMKPESLKNVLKNVDAVIYCAASRPKVKIDPLDPMLNKQNNVVSKDDYVEESNHVEDVGLKNVVNEVIKNNVKKLVIVSSICAKCQKNMKNEYENPGEVIDRGETTCEPCFNKQEGEELVKLMYEKHQN